MNETQERNMQASFTVEAALIMTILIPVLISLIYAGFYIHDCGVAQGIVCELASMGGNLRTEKSAQSMLEERRDGLGKKHLLGTTNRSISITKSDQSANAAFSGSFRVPGLISRFLSSAGEIARSWTRKILRPCREIRKIRGIKETLDQFAS